MVGRVSTWTWDTKVRDSHYLDEMKQHMDYVMDSKSHAEVLRAIKVNQG